MQTTRAVEAIVQSAAKHPLVVLWGEKHVELGGVLTDEDKRLVKIELNVRRHL